MGFWSDAGDAFVKYTPLGIIGEAIIDGAGNLIEKGFKKSRRALFGSPYQFQGLEELLSSQNQAVSQLRDRANMTMLNEAAQYYTRLHRGEEDGTAGRLAQGYLDQATLRNNAALGGGTVDPAAHRGLYSQTVQGNIQQAQNSGILDAQQRQGAADKLASLQALQQRIDAQQDQRNIARANLINNIATQRFNYQNKQGLSDNEWDQRSRIGTLEAWKNVGQLGASLYGGGGGAGTASSGISNLLGGGGGGGGGGWGGPTNVSSGAGALGNYSSGLSPKLQNPYDY